MRYRAFLSYSHADEKWARWLLRKLEAYRVPAKLVDTPGLDGPVPDRLGKFFRDRDELPSSGDLSSTILRALERSDALIVICSPDSAQSRWVNAEIDSFRENGRLQQIFSFVVAGDPASREPGKACFPPSLIRPEHEGMPEPEPLAADARKIGDGRERAFLKLVAGLLGVGFDSLAQRQAQRRQKRMVAITALSLAGMTLAIMLAVSAYIARNDAQRRQGQAEDILGFMVGDLRENLETVGRLDLMRSVDDKATAYFATLDPRDLSDRSLEEQARSLTRIGEVRINEGNNSEAMAAFKEAHARSSALYERQVDNGQRLFDLAQAQYWIGFVAWQQGRYDDAGIWLTRYRDSGIKLAAMDPSNFDWQREPAYGYQTLAVLNQSLRNHEEAKQQMLAVREIYADWLKQYPEDLELRFEDADNASWLGSIASLQGQLQQAESFFAQKDEAIQEIMRRDPENARWKETRLDALQLLVDAQVKLGKFDEAFLNNSIALTLAEELTELDSSNNVWQVSLGISQYWQSLLTNYQRFQLAQLAVETLLMAHQHAEENQSIALWLARAMLFQAQLSLESGKPEAALETVQKAQQLTEGLWHAEANESARLVMAESLIMLGEAQNANGDDAQGSWQAALRLLVAEGGSDVPFARLEPLVRVLYLLGRENEAAKHTKRLEVAAYVPLRPLPET